MEQLSKKVNASEEVDIRTAFLSGENYFKFFTPITKIHEELDNSYATSHEAFMAEVTARFGPYLKEKPKKADEFLIPEVPKFIKKEPKEKRESSRTSRRKNSEMNKTVTVHREASTVLPLSDETFRRSSRIASKTKPTLSSQQRTIVESHNFISPEPIVSPSHRPSKMRRTDESQESETQKPTPLPLEVSVLTTDIKEPLGSSTPISPMEITPQADRNLKKEKCSDEENTTPVSESAGNMKVDSVKKRIEEFEKRSKAALYPSKLPIKTPEKSRILLPNPSSASNTDINRDIFAEENSSGSRQRVLRANSKILQEKTNVKDVKEKVDEAQKKRAGMIKATIEEKQRKREERGKKAAALREAAEKEKLEAAMKLEKEKDEKFKQIQKQKDEKLKEEHLKKKQLAAMKAAEMEERRRQEDAARMARLKEAEEEQKRILAQKQQKKLEEARLQEQAAKMKEKAKALIKAEEKKKKKYQSKTGVNEYDIENIEEDDSSDDEEKPKKQVPQWASKESRLPQLKVQAWLDKDRTVYPWYYNESLKRPDSEALFPKVKMRPRTSSACWNNTVVDFNESFPL